MTLTTIRWYPYAIPLRSSFTTAHGVLAVRTGAIVEAIMQDAPSGFGEIAPMPEFAGGDLDTALAPLPMLCQQLSGKHPAEALDLLYAQALPPSTVCGLESALLDGLARSEGRSVHTYVTDGIVPSRASIPVNAVVGAAALADAVEQARMAVAAGFGCVKLKMGKGPVSDEIERVAAVREAIGPALHLRLDANEAWYFEQAVTILSSCLFYNIQYIEQPLPASDLDGMHRLRQVVSIPIAADEAVYDLASARSVLAHAAADILIVKPQLAGGLRSGQQIMHIAAADGVQCVITSTIESGIGLAGALHLAAASPFVTLECGLATLGLLADDLLLDTLPIRNGCLSVPNGPGLGVQLNRAALARYRIKRRDRYDP